MRPAALLFSAALLLTGAGCTAPRPSRPPAHLPPPAKPPIPEAEPVRPEPPEEPSRPAPPPAKPALRPAPPEEWDRSNIALAYRQEKYRQVVDEFHKLLRRYPSHLKSADDLYYLGMSHYYLEEHDLALKAFLEFQYRFLMEPRLPEVMLMTARVFRRMNRADRALESLEEAARISRDPSVRRLVREEEADILAGEGRFLESLSTLDEAYREGGPEDREPLLEKIENLLAIMPLDEIGESVMAGEYRFPRELTEEVYARRLELEGKMEDEPDDTVEPSTWPSAVELPGAYLPAPAEGDHRPVRKLAVLAPASGRLEAFGREVRRGVDLALESLAGPSFPYRVEALHIDEKNGDEVDAGLDEMLSSEEVLILIGPLASSTVERIVDAAERHSLPIFSPTASSPRLAGISRNFFRNCHTLEELGRELAVFAVDILGVETFAIFSPEDAYGLGFAEIFEREVTELGASVVALESYDTELTDFAKPIKALKRAIGMPDPLPEPGGREGRGGYVLPFEGIFLPGYAEQVGLVVPQLAFHDIDVRRLAVLGGSGLNTPRFPETGEEFSEGAFFIDGFFAGSPQVQVQRFVSLYRERYDEDPGTFAAQAYDAAAIVLSQLRQGAVSREAMLSALGGVRDFQGVLGPTTLLPGGQMERPPFFGTVFKGHLVSLDLLPPLR